MIRAVWFMIKVGLAAALAVWVANRPGSVHLQWLSYDLKIHMGLFLLGLLAILFVSILLSRVIYVALEMPARLRRLREERRQKKGYRALTLGLTAVAAGDSRAAGRYATRAEQFLKNDTGLPVLLKAQAARLNGREEDAKSSFMALLENKDTAFLGIRGLLQAALDSGEDQQALRLAAQALALHPRQPWILKLLYGLQIRTREWAAARKTLTALQRAGGMAEAAARPARRALWLAEADDLLAQGFRLQALAALKAAARLDPVFVPTALRLAKYYGQEGQRRAAMRVLKKAWAANPHPDLAPRWLALMPAEQPQTAVERMRWLQRLARENPDHGETHIMLARGAIESALWGEARDHLMQGQQDVEPDRRVYQLLARLERESGGREQAARMWEAKALEALPERQWVCSETGRVYEGWQALALPHLAFNTMVWGRPKGEKNDTNSIEYKDRVFVS